MRVRYRDREVLTNPPPSAGGTLLAYALALLDRGPAPPGLGDVVAAMGAAQGERTAEFVEGLSEVGFLERFLARNLGSTTHISVLDADGPRVQRDLQQRRGLRASSSPARGST